MAGDRYDKRIGMDFTQGPVMPLLLKFFLPFMAASILNSLYNTVDTIIIGQFVGSVGIVSVTMGGKMLNMATTVGLAFAGGGQVLIAQLTGAGRKDRINSAVGTMFTEMFCIAVICSAVMLIFGKQILTVLNTPAQAMEGAYQYLIVTSAGLPLMFLYTAVSSALGGMGDSRRPLIFIAIAALVNLAGDIVFIVVFHLDALGTAIATVIGQAVSLICSVTYLYRRREKFGFDFRLKSFAVNLEHLKVMIKIGFPNALRGIFISGTQLYLIGNVNIYGVSESAAYSIGDKVYHLTNVFVNSVGQGAGGMVAQNVGAGRSDRVKKVVLDTFIVSMTGAVVLSALSLLIPYQIYGLFTSEASVLAFAPAMMRVCALIYFMCAFQVTFNCVLTGTGASVLSFIGGILDGVVFRMGFSLLFADVLGWGVVGYFMGEALARLGPILVGGIYYFTGVWKRRGSLIKDS